MKKLALAVIAIALAVSGCTKLSSEDIDSIATRVYGKLRQPDTPKPPVNTEVKLREIERQLETEKFKNKRLREEAANRTYVEQAQVRAMEIRISDGSDLIAAFVQAFENNASYTTHSPVYLGALNDFLGTFENVLIGVRELEPGMAWYYGTVEMARSEVRAATIAWIRENPKAVALAWKVVRPIARQNYGLLAAFRQQKQLFETPYSEQAFAPLRECLGWHEQYLYASSEERATPHPEEKRCNAVFKSWKLDAQFGQQNDNSALENTKKVLGQFTRREQGSGVKFVHVMQKYARDYIATK